MGAPGNEPRSAPVLRSALADRLVAQGVIHDHRVEAAFRSVARHVFVPNVSLEAAYTDDVVLMKTDEAGVAISTVSQPTVVALMLEQAGVEPGHRVLEIGSGGYNAALLKELAGPAGEVTTIDIDADVTDRARRRLAAAGYPEVRVVRTDGEFGWPQSAPYDRVIVTVTAWDIAPAWREQLADGGRIVVPLRLRNQTRSIALDLVDGVLRSRSMAVCGFVSMQGAGADYERVLPVHGDKVSLSFDNDQLDQRPPPHGVLKEPAVAAWSGVLVNREEPLSDLDLWLASALPGYCVLHAEPSALKEELVSPVPRWGASAMVEEGTLAYLTGRPAPDPDFVELGAIGHGRSAAEGAEGAERLAAQLRHWDEKHRGGPDPALTIQPAETPAGQWPAGFHIRRRHSVITITWPGETELPGEGG
jgi:protein-L-isoaspartate(D-aspartate) O-methyltransferase